MDTAQWPQEMVVKPMDEIITNQSSKSSSLERKTKPQRDQVVNCPRCNSTNTKFCYYNNYSLSQPRYFCKTCRRYWTAGGSLRNIPVGGGSRKNKRSSSSSSNSNSSSSSSLSSKRVHDHLGNNGGFIGGGSITAATNVSSQLSQNPKNNIHGGQDLNLCFPPPPPPPSSSSDHFKTFTELIQVPNYDNHNTNNNENNPSSSPASASASASSQLSAMELLTGMTSRGLNSFMPMPSIVDPNTIYSSGFPLSEPKNSLNFSLEGLGNGGLFGGLQSVQDQTNNGRLFFPFEDLKQVSNTANVTTDAQQNIDQNADSTGYWNGVLGGGTW